DETQIFDLHDEPEEVAALPEPDKVEGAVPGSHIERRRLLVVERTQTFQCIATRRPECHVLTDNVIEPVPLAYCRDVALPNAPCHAPSLGAVDNTPADRAAGSPYDGTTVLTSGRSTVPTGVPCVPALCLRVRQRSQLVDHNPQSGSVIHRRMPGSTKQWVE